jgi:hypothetical protein
MGLPATPQFQPCKIRARSAGRTNRVGERSDGESSYGARNVTGWVYCWAERRSGSIDGEGGERLLAWYFGGDTEYRLPGTEMVFKVSPRTAEYLRETSTTTGALVTGRRTFDLYPWVGWRTSFGGTGVCSYPFGSARVGLRRIALYVRHGRPRKRCSASESGRR